MKKNKLMKSLFFFLFFPLVIFSQSNEPFIKVDKNFIDNLEGVDDVVNEELSLNTYRERFDFLNANTFLNIEYNEVNYAYVKKWGSQLLCFVTLWGLLLWWIIDWFRVPSIIRRYNKDLSIKIMTEMSLIYNTN